MQLAGSLRKRKINATNKDQRLAVGIVLFISCFAAAGVAQTPQTLKRTITKTDKFDFGAGGTVVIAGAPNGTIVVTGSTKNEIEISAEIQIEAATAEDLDRIASVTTFLTEESPGRVGISDDRDA